MWQVVYDKGDSTLQLKQIIKEKESERREKQHKQEIFKCNSSLLTGTRAPGDFTAYVKILEIVAHVFCHLTAPQLCRSVSAHSCRPTYNLPV